MALDAIPCDHDALLWTKRFCAPIDDRIFRHGRSRQQDADRHHVNHAVRLSWFELCPPLRGAPFTRGLGVIDPRDFVVRLILGVHVEKRASTSTRRASPAGGNEARNWGNSIPIAAAQVTGMNM